MEKIKAIWLKNQRYVLTLVGCIAIALVIGGILMAVAGYNPFDGYYAMIKGSLGSPRCLGNTLDKSMTLCLLGLATAIGAKGGLFNVGGEGQLFMGALVSTMIGLWFADLPAIIVIIVAIICAILAGGIYAWIPAVLKIKMGVDEVITTIMLNTVAIKICTWLVNGPWNSPLKSITTGTDYLPENFRFLKIITSSNMSVSFIYGAFVAFLIWYLLKKTTTGLQIKVVGENARFAKFAGLKADKLGIMSMVISGAICGLVGMFLVYGFQGHMTATASNNYYFDGMLVAMIMRYNPVGTIIMSFFFGIMATGATNMELMYGIPNQLYDIIFATIIFLMAAENGFSKYLENRATQRIARAKAKAKIRKEDANNVGSDIANS